MTRDPVVSPRLGGRCLALPSTSIVSNRGKLDISSNVNVMAGATCIHFRRSILALRQAPPTHL